MSIELFPAIDLKGGKVVRLYQGDYEQMTVYSENPTEIAVDFVKKGAKNLHIVDLDGAKDGSLENLPVIEKILKETSLFVQVGGGIRDHKAVKSYLDIGVSRVILGTAAVTNPEFLKEVLAIYGEKIAVGVDVKDGYAAIKGWRELSAEPGMEFCRKMRDLGVKTVIYTDISRDGAMEGTNISAYEELNKIQGLDIVASGGISSLDEIKILRKIGLYGAILGKSLYTGKIDISEALATAKGP